MNRLFGNTKKEQPKVQPVEEKYDITQHTAKLDSKTTELDSKLKKLEDEIREYHAKLKKTVVVSEQNYLKGRLKNLLMQRKMIEQQMNRYFGQKMMVDKVQYNHEMVQDTINMGKFLDQTNKVQQQQLKNFDIDKMQDVMEDMEERAWENDRLADIVNQDFTNQNDLELDDELEGLEAQLDVQAMMQQDNTKNKNFKYNPLSD